MITRKHASHIPQRIVHKVILYVTTVRTTRRFNQLNRKSSDQFFCQPLDGFLEFTEELIVPKIIEAKTINTRHLLIIVFDRSLW